MWATSLNSDLYLYVTVHVVTLHDDHDFYDLYSHLYYSPNDSVLGTFVEAHKLQH